MINQQELSILEKQLDSMEITAGHQSGEPGFLTDLRKKAEASLDRLSIPGPKNEAWKYTPVKAILDKKFVPESLNQNLLHAAGEKKLGSLKIKGLECYTIVLVNGRYSSALSDQVNPEELTILDFEKAFSEHSFSEYFNKNDRFKNDYFLSLNLSKANAGLFIEVKKGITVSKPLHILNVLSSSENVLLNRRSLYVLHASSSLELIESTVADDLSASLVQNKVTEVILAEQASLNQTFIQQGNEFSAMLSAQDVNLARDSHYSANTFTLKGAFTRNSLNLYLEGSNIEAHMNGFYQTSDGELVDNHTLADHQKSHCESNELYKGILKGKSTGVFNGKVFVHPDAQKTNAYQQNNSILLDAEATMNSKPELEIYADDVKCSHGSTIGQLNADSLFYLKARGISERAGKILLMKAFAYELTQRLKQQALRDHLNELIGS